MRETNCVALLSSNLTFFQNILLVSEGDAANLESFAGAHVVYFWVRGAGNDLANHLFELVDKDKQLKILATSEKCTDKELVGLGMRFVDKIFAKEMTIYFYAKIDTMIKKHLDRRCYKENKLTTTLRDTFKKKAALKQLPNSKVKNDEFKKYLCSLSDYVADVKLSAEPDRKDRKRLKPATLTYDA